MEKTNPKRTGKNKKFKKKNNRRKLFGVLIKLILCMIVISNAFAGYNNKKNVQAVSNLQASQENNKTETPEKSEKTAMVNDNRGVPVICYHSVSKDESKKGPIIIPKDKLREQLKTIKDNGYTTLTMAELNDYLLKNQPIPEKSVIITFDDGYRDNYTNAFPILKEFNMKATIFVISSYLNRDLYLTSDEINEMSEYGFDIESHTVSHKKLSTLSYKEQLKELKNSKETIENLTHKQVISIAYPEGKYNNDTKKAVADAGYSMGFTIERGYADRNDNLAVLNRICIDYTYKPNNILNVLKNLKK